MPALQPIFSALLILLLAACASTSPNTPGKPPNSSSKSPVYVDRADINWYWFAKRPGDIWDRMRRGFQMPNIDNTLVQRQQDWYVARPEYVQRMTERSKRYLYYIVELLETRHMPTELALLPFIESAYNPQALSIAKAAGMWQFIPGTGRRYNLKQNLFQDERRDVLASTNAALDYLSSLHQMFGDWYLALAAYNWGEGNVQRAILRNQDAGLPTDYFSLKLPVETRNYVPKLQAVKNIAANPQKVGLTLPDIPNHPYFMTVTTSRDIDVKVAAQLSGLPLAEFKSLNPSFRKPVILGASHPQILLPFDNVQTFATNLKAYRGSLSSWTTYKVGQTIHPAVLAKKIGVNLTTLVSVNKIPAGMRLKPGSTVLVPRADDDEDISADVAENAILAMEPNLPATRKMLIRVRRRETITQVAKRYHVSVAQIRSWNRSLSSPRRNNLAPGQVLALHVPTAATSQRQFAHQPARPLQRASRAKVKTVKTVKTASVRRPIRNRISNHSRAVKPERVAYAK